MLKTNSNNKKKAPRRKSNEEQALNEMKSISVMKGKKNKQKLADILSVLKVANMDKKKERKVTPKKEDEKFTFQEIPTDDITLTTDDETISEEQNLKSETQKPKTNELEKENKKEEKPKQQSSVDTIHLDELFSPKKIIEKSDSVSQGEKTDNEITLDKIQGDVDVKSGIHVIDDEAEVIDIPETSRQPEVKFAKINIGGGGGTAPKKIENSVQGKSEKKQKRSDSTVSLKSEEKRLSSAGSSSSSSSGAELYVCMGM